jgi:hypothetical protein
MQSMRKKGKSEREGEPTATVDEVRAQLFADAEAVMNESVPTPTPADIDKFLMGGHLDDKEESDPPEMLPVGMQQAMLAAAAPNPPPDNGGVVTAPPVNVDVPYVDGDGTAGSTLSCTMGNWDNEPTSYQYAWQTDGVPNSATGDTYNVVPGDAGKSIACIVTATNESGSTTAPVSNAVAISAARNIETRELAAGDNNPGYQTRTVPKR